MALCDDCAAYKTFGKKCWFYWEMKSKCSQFKKSHSDEPGFKEEE